jgi:hypothetical protein
MMKIETKFNIGDTVKIAPLENLKARIINIIVLEDHAVKYNVEYWWNGELYTTVTCEADLI